jgi:hypothetical protein
LWTLSSDKALAIVVAVHTHLITATTIAGALFGEIILLKYKNLNLKKFLVSETTYKYDRNFYANVEGNRQDIIDILSNRVNLYLKYKNNE